MPRNKTLGKKYGDYFAFRPRDSVEVESPFTTLCGQVMCGRRQLIKHLTHIHTPRSYSRTESVYDDHINTLKIQISV